MSKHTPGPWKTEINKATHRPSVMLGKDERWEVTASSIGDSTANARLIAAAPEMYKELENIVNTDYRKWEKGLDNPEQFIEWAKNRCRFLLAKIDGGE